MNKVVAIDGPAGSGKSSTCKELAKRLGYKYLDTGAFYRGVTYYALAQEVPLEDDLSVLCAVLQFCAEININALGSTADFAGFNISLDPANRWTKIGVEDITDAIRTRELTGKVHFISTNLEAREHIVKLLQAVVAKYADAGIILEGRDTTDVVAPEAALRVVLTASEAVRATRRANEHDAAKEQVLEQISLRDARDAEVNQFHAGGDGVIELDNTTLTLMQTVDALILLCKPFN